MPSPPGLGNWPTGLVYLVKGNEVYELSADLSTATRIALIPGSAGTHSGITFDRTGKWDYDMIITHQGGAVYRVSRSVGGVYTWSYVANTNTMQESPRIITDDPAKWGAYAGCITTSSENTYQVFAICQNTAGGYSVSTLATNIANAEASDVRPTTGESTFGSTPYVYFLSAFNYNRIVAYSAADLPTNSAGDLFVSQEYTGGVVRVTGAGTRSTFANGGSEHYEGSNFCFAAQAVDTAEDCDDGVDNDHDGNTDAADEDCWVCGDGDVDPGEGCDDGNVVYGDGCGGDCVTEITDTDGDGTPDDSDICPGFDDRLDADSDGIPDGCDFCPTDATNDADSDGVCGALDQCPGFPDSDNADGDALPDGCDACPLDAANDADSDGVCGNEDICPGFDDTVDADTDGIPDGCDDCPNDAENDADNDGVCGDVDICPGFDDLLDNDGDFDPDGCDSCPNDAENDADGDGVCGDVDSCEGYNDNDNADGDEIPDACDDCPADAENDADGDGVCGDVDLCANTGAETVPTRSLGTNRWADVDGDGVFDTTASRGKGPGRAYTIEDTEGCTCSQIIAFCGYGSGHTQFGCSISVMDAWVAGYPYCH